MNNLMPNSMDGLPSAAGMTINFRVLELAKVLILLQKNYPNLTINAPPVQVGLNNLMPNSMDGLPIVPWMTINFRVLEPAKV